MVYKLTELNSMLQGGMTVFEYYYEQVTGLPSNRFIRKVKSPFLRNGNMEKDPSFHVFYNPSKDQYLFKDHGLERIGTHWQFVMDLYGLDFKDAVKKVKYDLLGIHEDGYISVPLNRQNFSYHRPPRKSGKIEIVPCSKDYSESELAFWKSFGISRPTLDLFQCSSINHYDVAKENKTFRITARPNSPMFGFQINGRHKIYQPHGDPKYKWTSNLIAHEDVFGFDLIPKQCEHLFLIGGNKDTMSFYENMGYPVIALASESTNLTEELFVFLRMIARNLWVFYDNDTQGYKKAKQFQQQYGLPYLNELLAPFDADDFAQFVHDYPDQVDTFRYALNEHINRIQFRK